MDAQHLGVYLIVGLAVLALARRVYGLLPSKRASVPPCCAKCLTGGSPRPH